MFAGGRLRHLELVGDEDAADAVADQVAVSLAGKMRRRVTQPFEDQKTLVAGEGSDDANVELRFRS